MRNLPFLFFGIMAMLAISWTGLVLSANMQLGGLQPAAVEEGAPYYPNVVPGLASQGKLVYTDLGCAACHTQQVRTATLLLEKEIPVKDKPGEHEKIYISPDIARGWSKALRGTVARDYIFQDRVLLGTLRIGPDLADVGDRDVSKPGSNWLMLHLYDPQLKTPGSIMPPYRFLFTTQDIGDQPSANALKFPAGYAHAPQDGHEIVPTNRAVELVAYLRSLKVDYELPEARTPVAPTAPAAAAPATTTAAATPAAAATPTSPAKP